MLKKVQQSNWESEQSLRKSIYLDATRFCKSGKMLFIYLFIYLIHFLIPHAENMWLAHSKSALLFFAVVFLLTNLSSEL